eukprot:EG_transcript_34428
MLGFLGNISTMTFVHTLSFLSLVTLLWWGEPHILRVLVNAFHWWLGHCGSQQQQELTPIPQRLQSMSAWIMIVSTTPMRENFGKLGQHNAFPKARYTGEKHQMKSRTTWCAHKYTKFDHPIVVVNSSKS